MLNKQDFFCYEMERDEILLMDGNRKYSIQDLLEEYDRIERLVLGNKQDGCAVILLFSDGIQLVLHYLAAAFNRISTVILAAETERDMEELCQSLPIAGIYHDLGYQALPQSSLSKVVKEDRQEIKTEGEIILQTSGTSGRRKLARIDNDVFFERVLMKHPYDETSVEGLKLVCVAPWHQICIQEIIRAIYFRFPTLVPYSMEEKVLYQMLQKFPVSNLVIKSSILTTLIENPNVLGTFLRGIDTVRYCLEPLQIDTLNKLQAVLKNVKLYSDYGITECVGTIAIADPKQHSLTYSGYTLPSIGRFLPEVERHIIDASGKEILTDEIGELVVHTPWQFKGYLGKQNYDGYWISTGDLGWMDKQGNVSISGFKKKVNDKADGNMYVLPAASRGRLVNQPFGFNSLGREDKRWETLQTMLMLLHGSLNIQEIKNYYLSMIPKLIPADAYGFEILPLTLSEHAPDKYSDDKWYQNAISEASHHRITIAIGGQGRVALGDLESYCRQPANIMYAPLFSKTAVLHCAVSFARFGKENDFTSLEMTMIKQITHHLNLALLNARTFQEIETRQILFQRTIEKMEMGVILSDSHHAIYYMNDAMEELLLEEDVPLTGGSIILEKFRTNISNIVRHEGQEQLHFTCYLKKVQYPVGMDISSVRLAQDSRFIVSFITSEKSGQEAGLGDLGQLLSEKEQTVLRHLCKGLSYKEIADTMDISINTVNFHIKNIYQKMNVNSRTEAQNKAMLLNGSGFYYTQKGN